MIRYSFPEVITLVGRDKKYYEIIKKTSFLTLNLYELKHHEREIKNFYLYTNLTPEELYSKRNIEILNVWNKLYKMCPTQTIFNRKMGLI